MKKSKYWEFLFIALILLILSSCQDKYLDSDYYSEHIEEYIDTLEKSGFIEKYGSYYIYPLYVRETIEAHYNDTTLIFNFGDYEYYDLGIKLRDTTKVVWEIFKDSVGRLKNILNALNNFQIEAIKSDKDFIVLFTRLQEVGKNQKLCFAKYLGDTIESSIYGDLISKDSLSFKTGWYLLKRTKYKVHKMKNNWYYFYDNLPEIPYY